MLWVARAVWLVLVFTSGTALDDALGDASGSVRAVAAVLAYACWGVALLALLAPRPLGFTVLRVAVTAAVGTAIASAWGAPARVSVPAIAVALVAAVVVTGADVARACAQADAYGYEERFPLRAPFALLVGGIPLVAGLVAAGIATGPLLLAAGQVVAGVVVAVVGVPLAVGLGRTLHHLERRLLVVVPAGCTLVDPLTLADPVLFPRRATAAIEPAPVRPPPGALDLRLGTAPGSLAIRAFDPAPIVRRTGATEGTTVSTDTVLCTPLRPRAFLAAWDTRRATRPPSTPAHPADP